MSILLRRGSLFLVLMIFCQFIFTTSICAEGLYGDLNGDGLVNSIDYAHLRGYLLKTSTPSGTDWEKYADIYQDSDINALDFAVFRQYILGMIKNLPFIPEQGNVPTPTPTPKEDWIPFIPQPGNVALNLVINSAFLTNSKVQRHIEVKITFNDGGYRIVDEGEMLSSLSESGEINFTTSGLQIEKYVGTDAVDLALMHKQIKYEITNELSDKNHFDFKVYDKSVTGFSFTQNSIITSTPAPYGAEVNEDFVKANTQFAANLFQKLSEEDAEKNMFFSPFSISMALSMPYQGAGSTTKEAMAKALNYTGMSDEEINQSYIDNLSYFKNLYPHVTLNVANSIWIRENFEVKESFLDKNKEVFNAHNSFLDFGKSEACDIMNKWISDTTKDKIDDLIEPPIDSSVMMYLMNAIYFNASWLDNFDEMKTGKSVFTNIKGKGKVVPMMNRTGVYNYAKTTEFQAVELPYSSGSVSMYCILPQNDNVNDFIAEFDVEKWNEIKSNLYSKSNVRVTIPRFKIEYKPEDLKGKLKGLGMWEAFSHEADFSGIAKDLFIGDVSHKAVIDVNERGTEAAAVTVIAMATPSIPESFVADKPFMFVIADNSTGTILFMGKVVDF